MTNWTIEAARERDGIEKAMDINGQYSEWSQPALAERLRRSNLDRHCLLAEVERLQATLDRVRGLPATWRSKESAVCHEFVPEISVDDCADELDAALKETDDE